MKIKARERSILFSVPMVLAILTGRKTQTRRVMTRNPPSESGGNFEWCPGGLKAGFHAFNGRSSRFHVPSGWAASWCPYGAPGYHLWVRETAYIAPVGFADKTDCNCTDPDGRPRVVGWAASMCGDSVRCATDYGVKKTPPIHLPRWASRITLEVTEIRVERLGDVTEADAISEGLRTVEGNGTGPGWGCKWNGPGYEGCYPGYYHIPGRDGLCTCNAVRPPKREERYRERVPSPVCAFREIWDSVNKGRGPGWDENPWVWVVGFKTIKP